MPGFLIYFIVWVGCFLTKFENIYNESFIFSFSYISLDTVCLAVSVLFLCLTVSWIGLWSVIMAFCGHTHLRPKNKCLERICQ